MAIYRINPLRDERWVPFLERHPDACTFHTPGWLEALRRTYGYEPVVFTTSAPGEELANGIAFCRVKSWITGSRLVSLPFSDHCQPLMDCLETLAVLMSGMMREMAREKWKYIEIRPLAGADSQSDDHNGYGRTEQYYFHKLDLTPDVGTVYRNFHKSCIQRKIQRAERESLTYEAGQSELLLKKFYHLLLLTRRRHQLPPQPFGWFENLIRCLGEKAVIHMASKDGRPVASILTLLYKRSLIYKYGCSDSGFHNLGGMPLLFWKAIQAGKLQGARDFDLGRSEMENAGLVDFKGHWGAASTILNYYRYPAQKPDVAHASWKVRTAKYAFARLPDSFMIPAGKLLYRHIG